MTTVKLGPGQIIVDRDMTRAQWRAKRNFSKNDYYKLRKQGRIPKLTAAGRITLAADAEWEQSEDELANSAAAKREAERRSELAAIAGRIAAKSPKHHCNRKKRQGTT